MGRKTLMGALGILLAGVLLGTTGFSDSAWPAVRTGAGIQANYLTVRPDNGPGGTEVRVQGYVGNDPRCGGGVTIEFVDAAGNESRLTGVPAGSINTIVNIPSGAALGLGQVRALVVVFRPPPQGGPPRCSQMVGARASFTVTTGPGIFGFTPRMGRVGTVVTITGIRFTGTNAVKFNGTPSAFSVDSDSQITATVPSGVTTGPIEIDVPTGSLIRRAISGPDFVICSAVCG